MIFKFISMSPFGYIKVAWPPLIPRTYIDETDKEITVCFEIPGVKKEDINLYASEHYLRLKAKVPEDVSKKLFKPKEYRKTVFLPTPVDPENAKSKYENGILTVTLPKKVPGKRILIE